MYRAIGSASCFERGASTELERSSRRPTSWCTSPKRLRVSTNEFLETRQLKNGNGENHDPEKLWRKFRKILEFTEKYQGVISRVFHSLATVRGNGNWNH